MFDPILVRDDFIAADAVRDLNECVALRRGRGEFRAASVGAERVQRADIRGDLTCWLEPPLLPPELALLEAFEALRLDWNQRTYLGLFDLEVHYALYPPGAGYARHVDQVRGGAARLVSVVLYLNEDWPADAGGELRIYAKAGAGTGAGIGASRDLAPVAGRLVSFVSEGLEHEVLPATRPRLSVSAWFRGRSTRKI